MSKKHDAIFDDVLSGLDASDTKQDVAGTRFLKRSTALSERLSGEREEKVLQWVDPASCRMWARHNRDYALLNEENCRDLIDGIKAQGQQEFPAIVRKLTDDPDGYGYEVICGARRHFAVSWLRANNYTQFKYLIEVRDLSDEEAFRLGDIENRDREDISDYERAIDYADAIERYYGGKQKAMADRLEVSQPWLSRYLALAKMPVEVVSAFASKRDIKERHARDLKVWLGIPATEKRVLSEAREIAKAQERARAGQGVFIDGAGVMKRLKQSAADPKSKADVASNSVDVINAGSGSISIRDKGGSFVVQIPKSLSADEVREALASFVEGAFDR